MKRIFPDNFLWGAATSAFQIEGAAALDGKGPSIWDEFSRRPGTVGGGAGGEVACDHYHLYRDDLKLMQKLSLRAYRFSISWPRVLPQGRGDINQVGLDFYDRLVDGLCQAGIEPLVTLYHWDLPAALQYELGGWTNPDLPRIFADYAQLLFDRLGDRVHYWLTLNEPWVVVNDGYFDGVHAPGMKDRSLGYLAGHNLMRAHAYAVARYRACRHNHGAISFALNTNYSFPASDAPEDVAAAERAMHNFGGWFGDPAYFGDYPAELRRRLGALLPVFSPEDSAALKNSLDFIALNYYTSDIVRHAPGVGPMELEYVTPPEIERTEMGWPIMPDGLTKILHWLSDRYGNLPLYITENGVAFDDAPDNSGFVNDEHRIAYLHDHISAAATAMHAGVDLRGYFLWSLMDNLEWSLGFAKRFGIVRCDHETQRRTIKASGLWYAKLIRDGYITSEPATPGRKIVC